MINIKKVIVIGAGTMGQGIAQWFSQQNIKVEMVDQNHDFAQSSLLRIHHIFDKLTNSGKISLADADHFKASLSVKSMEQIDPQADLVIEAIIENLEIKKVLFQKLDLMMGPETILASNTSSFPINLLAQDLSENRKTHFLGLHFFNPAPIMKLVEVISGLETKSALINEMVEWFEARKKIACTCSDSPGFIVNRVARNFYGEALRAAETYDLEKCREIDNVMKEVGGFKMGPFELMDLIGIDINLSVTESIYQAFYHETRFRPHRLQRDMVAAGRLGKKSKKGFYIYES